MVFRGKWINTAYCLAVIYFNVHQIYSFSNMMLREEIKCTLMFPKELMKRHIATPVTIRELVFQQNTAYRFYTASPNGIPYTWANSSCLCSSFCFDFKYFISHIKK